MTQCVYTMYALPTFLLLTVTFLMAVPHLTEMLCAGVRASGQEDNVKDASLTSTSRNVSV